MNNEIKNNMDNEIKNIIEKNKVDDLKKFLQKRQCLNSSNLVLMYFFHLLQSTGIILTSYAAGTNSQHLIWIGISLNMCATLINIYEKQNNIILKKLLIEINLIKDGLYVDEGHIVEIDNKELTDTPLLQKKNEYKTF